MVTLRSRTPPNTRVQRTRSSPSAPHSPLTRHPLGRARRHWPLNDLCELASRSTSCDQGAEQQVESDRGVSSLHLGHSRLAGANEFGEARLGQPPGLSAHAQALGKCESQLDKLGLLSRESQELSRGADLPPCGLESLFSSRFSCFTSRLRRSAAIVVGNRQTRARLTGACSDSLIAFGSSPRR